MHEVRASDYRPPVNQYEQQQQAYDISTPILEQFMQESNLKQNMALRGRDQAKKKPLMEESSFSAVDESAAFVRRDLSPHEHSSFLQGSPSRSRRIFQPHESKVRESQTGVVINQSSLSRKGEQSGILGQFIKAGYP